MQPQATEPLEKVDKFFETFYSYIVRDALDVSLAFSAHGRVEDHPNVPGLSQVGTKPCAVHNVIGHCTKHCVVLKLRHAQGPSLPYMTVTMRPLVGCMANSCNPLLCSCFCTSAG